MLGSRTVGISAIQDLITRGSKVSRPAKVNVWQAETCGVHCDGYHWDEDRRIAVAVLLPSLILARTACCPYVHSNDCGHEYF